MATIITGTTVYAMQLQKINGPTHRQALKMAARRKELLAEARRIEDAEPERALDLDSDAWDIENDLTIYGFRVETGRPVR